MEANELRLGNLVSYGVHDVKIKSIHTESVLKNKVTVYVEISEKLRNYCLYIEEIHPIPLTEEWLLKCGFENDYESRFRKCFVLVSTDMSFTYNLSKHEKELSRFDIKGLGINLNCTKYVHQLQNLYFALTNEELIIK